MRELLQRNLQFIAWGNLINPRIYALWLSAAAALALCVYVASLAGRLAYAKRGYRSATEELVLTTTVGFAALVVPLFILAAFGAYRPIPLIVLGAAVIATTAWRGGHAPLVAPVLGWWKAAREHPALWIFFGLTSLAALLPAIRVDETSYHLAQVQQWVEHGRLSVDPYMVYPLYTNNWHLLMGVAMLLGGVSAVHLLTWAAGV